MKKQITSIILTGTLASMALGACAPTVATRGNLVSDARLAMVKPYEATRAQVAQAWGPPTLEATLDPGTWYYVGETTKRQGLFAEEVDQRRIIRVRFNAMDEVTEVVEIDPKTAQDVNLVDRKTPTAGKDYTVFQQFVGNIGRFNPGAK